MGWQSRTPPSIAKNHSNRESLDRKLYMENYMRRTLLDRYPRYRHYGITDSRNIRPFVNTAIPEYKRPSVLILRIRSHINSTGRNSLKIN